MYKRQVNFRVMVRPKTIAKFMLEKKATNIKIFDVRKITSITDFFIVCDASSEPQIKAILNHVSRSLKKKGMRPVNIEGQDRNDWVLIDYFDFIIHIFSEDKRAFYDIDRLWADAKITHIEDQNEK